MKIIKFKKKLTPFPSSFHKLDEGGKKTLTSTTPLAPSIMKEIYKKESSHAPSSLNNKK